MRHDIRDYCRQLESSKTAFRSVVRDRNGLRDNLRALEKRMNQRSNGAHASIELEKSQLERKLADMELHVHFLEAELASTHHHQEGLRREISSLSARLEEHAMERSELARSVLVLDRTDLLPFYCFLQEDIDLLHAHVGMLTPESIDHNSLLGFIEDILNGFRSIITAGLEGRRSVMESLVRPPVARDYASFFSAETGPSAFDYAREAGNMVRPDFDTLVCSPVVSPSLPVISISGWDELNAMLHENVVRSSSAPPELSLCLSEVPDGDSLYAESLGADSSGQFVGGI